MKPEAPSHCERRLRSRMPGYSDENQVDKQGNAVYTMYKRSWLALPYEWRRKGHGSSGESVGEQ